MLHIFFVLLFSTTIITLIWCVYCTLVSVPLLSCVVVLIVSVCCISVPEQLDESTASAVNILQQIIDMS